MRFSQRTAQLNNCSGMEFVKCKLPDQVTNIVYQECYEEMFWAYHVSVLLLPHR